MAKTTGQESSATVAERRSHKTLNSTKLHRKYCLQTKRRSPAPKLVLTSTVLTAVPEILVMRRSAAPCGGSLESGEARPSGAVLGAYRKDKQLDIECPSCATLNPANAHTCAGCGDSLAKPKPAFREIKEPKLVLAPISTVKRSPNPYPTQSRCAAHPIP